MSPRSSSFTGLLRNTKNSPGKLSSDIYRRRAFSDGVLAGVLGDEEEDGGDEDRLDGTVRGLGPRGTGGMASEAHLARRLTKGRKSRRILSSKPQDFQVGTARRLSILVLPPSGPASSNCSDVGKDPCYEPQPS